jgi:hypothetical protein
MTDPRLAALADVLRADFGPSWFPGLTDVTIIAKTPEEAATAILAALPPDWCGHEDLIARLRKTVDEGYGILMEQRANTATLRTALEDVADWAHDCSPSNTATPWERQTTDEIDPRVYGFDDIEDRCRAALAQVKEATE